MTLKEKVQGEMKVAMKAKDQDALRALRAIKSLILLEETAEGNDGTLSEEAELKLLQKAVKQRKDSAAVYAEQKRDDLEKTELAEIAIIEKFLPQQLSDEELAAAIKAIVDEVGASSIKDMGKVMGVASKKLAGQADNKRVSIAVKQLLG